MRNMANSKQNFKERSVNPLRNKMVNAFFRAKGLLQGKSGDQMTGWLIVVLLVVVVGAVFLTLYQDSISQVWNSIVSKITGLLN